jgi:hypothetical protein
MVMLGTDWDDDGAESIIWVDRELCFRMFD